MDIGKTFPNIDDELRWYAVQMSEGNLEAVGQFVEGRNELREKNKNNNKKPKERNV